ncbi:glyoxalase superfamily protein [Minwuia sp.]|uniref:glyoxalase superfamily protein n=1 Tax=Minwuia sp. TaxID=2493630 RepID=UPI003A94D952
MTHAITLPSIAEAKSQARRLRSDLEASGTPISYSRALELVAHQHGQRDWNTLHAMIGNRQPGPPVAVGQTVRGLYLGKPFSAEVLGVRSMAQAEKFRITIRFDEPVNVSGFESFEVLRRQVSANIDRNGTTAERTSNGQPQLSLHI